MCIDFRKLNKITARDNFPLPLIEDQLDLLAGKKYFTTLDLKDGFFYIKMHEKSIKYTSFAAFVATRIVRIRKNAIWVKRRSTKISTFT